MSASNFRTVSDPCNTTDPQVGGWKGTTDTHELIEQTHKRYIAGKRGKAEQYAVATAVTAVTAAERKVKQAME